MTTIALYWSTPRTALFKVSFSYRKRYTTMTSIEHPKIVHCFQHSQDPRVRLIIGNLACGLFDVDLYISNEFICNENSRISMSRDPKDLTDFISRTVVGSNPNVLGEGKIRKRNKLSMARAFVLRETDRLKLSKSETLQAYNALMLFIVARKIPLSDFKVDNGINGVSFDEGMLVFLSDPLEGQ